MTEKRWMIRIRNHVQYANPVFWVIEQQLACSPRPLRYHKDFDGKTRLIPAAGRSALVEWITSITLLGIKTIVVLATTDQMKWYKEVVSPSPDLVTFYRSCGFLVHHHPVEDPHHASQAAKPALKAQLEDLKPRIFGEFVERTGAMLIHCSGGMDRTAPIGAYVAYRAAMVGLK